MAGKKIGPVGAPSGSAQHVSTHLQHAGVDAHTANRIAQRGPQGLPQPLQEAFGHDLHDVRVHQGHSADQARAISAAAYSADTQIAFAPGSSSHGQHLLAHEVTHVVQQGPARPR